MRYREYRLWVELGKFKCVCVYYRIEAIQCFFEFAVFKKNIALSLEYFETSFWSTVAASITSVHYIEIYELPKLLNK